MQCRFNLNAKVEIKYRDETVVGIVDEINEREFHVVGEAGQDYGWLPNDVGVYVEEVN